MFVEVVFERDPVVVLQLLASRNINIEGSYLDTETDIYRIIVDGTHIQVVASLLSRLRQKYTVSPVIVLPLSPTPGQLVKVWLSQSDIAATYQIENNRVAIRLRST